MGAGFGGLLAALELEKKFKKNSKVEIVLIDKHDYFLFTPNLFKVAASEEEFLGIKQAKRNVVLPLREILQGKKIKFIRGEAKLIDQKARKVVLENRQQDYDYLILALGSKADFHNVKGAKEYALPLKTLSDALRIRNQIEFAVQQHRHDARKKELNIVLVGGGCAAVELAGELCGCLDFIAWKNQYPKGKIHPAIVEGLNCLMPGFDSHFSRLAERRLKKLGIRIKYSVPVFEVQRNQMEILGGGVMPFDVLIWMAGSYASEINFLAPVERGKKNQIIVDEFLRAKSDERIFVIGDSVHVLYKGRGPVFDSVENALAEAKYVASALPVLMENKRPPVYGPRLHGFIVNIGGKWALMSDRGIYLQGYLAYLIDKFAHFRFYKSFLGFWKAFNYVFFNK